MKTDEMQKQNKMDLEPFYMALENDRRLLEEAYEILLEMVNNEPQSVKNIALLIKDEYRNLYNEIAKLDRSNQDKGNTPSCCG